MNWPTAQSHHYSCRRQAPGTVSTNQEPARTAVRNLVSGDETVRCMRDRCLHSANRKSARQATYHPQGDTWHACGQPHMRSDTCRNPYLSSRESCTDGHVSKTDLSVPPRQRWRAVVGPAGKRSADLSPRPGRHRCHTKSMSTPLQQSSSRVEGLL